MDFSLLIPAFNEAHTIARAVDETRRFFDALGSFEILIVDDGSVDETASIVERLQRDDARVRLIRHQSNLGKGAAVKSGAAQALGDVMLFLDADLSTHPEAFRAFLPLLPTADILIGSRRVDGATIAEYQPFYRNGAGQIFNCFIRYYLGLHFQDTQCGFKVFHRRTLYLFEHLESKGWAFDVELLLRAQRDGLVIREVPVTWRNGKESRVRLSDAWSILRELRRMKLR